MNADAAILDKFAGQTIDLPGLGRLHLTEVLKQTTETTIYRVSHPEIVVKTFDLDCGKAGEISYGPYMRFGLELANFEDIMAIQELRRFVPFYYGANVLYDHQYAYIAMEFLHGEDMQTWCDEAAAAGYPEHWLGEFKEEVYSALSIMRRFHKHGIILVDFKPDNMIRLSGKGIKFVDLGAFFTPRHHKATDKYLYSATPDYSELLIDASNIQTGLPPTEAADIFSAGVALFEMATRSSRLEIGGETADEILAHPELYKFRDSQIRDLCHQFPHLRDLLPLVEVQLKERCILFAEIWHLLKGYVASKVPEWEQMSAEQHDQIILATGTTFIQEQLPAALQWLAGPIAQCTALRNARLKRVAELMKLMESPAEPSVKESLEQNSLVVQYLKDLGLALAFLDQLNSWDARRNPRTGCHGISGAVTYQQLQESALFTFARQVDRDAYGNRYYQLVGDLEADDHADGKLTLDHLKDDHYAWIM